jgi:ankyrin repeat protein
MANTETSKINLNITKLNQLNLNPNNKNTEMMNTTNNFTEISNELKSKEDLEIEQDLQDILIDINNPDVAELEILIKLKKLYQNDESFLKKFRAQFKIYRTESDGFSLLHHAIKKLRPKLAYYIMETIGIDSNCLSTKTLQTPLHTLCNLCIIKPNSLDEERRQIFDECFDILINKDAKCNIVDASGKTPLHFTAINNNYEGAKKLLELDTCDIHIMKNKSTALHYACQYGHDEISQMLIDLTDTEYLSFIQIENGNLPLHLVARQNKENIPLIEKQLKKIEESETSADYLNNALNCVDERGQSLIEIAIENSHFNLVEFLLKKYDIDKNKRNDKTGNTLIHTAAQVGSIEILDLLVKYSPNLFM